MTENKTTRKIPRKPGGGLAGKMMPGEKANDFKGSLKKLFAYLKPHRVKLIFVFLFAIISTIFSIISPAILGLATDKVVEGVTGSGIDFDKLLELLLILLGLYGVSLFFGMAEGWLMAKVSQRVIYSLRERMSNKLDKLPLKYFDNQTHGEIQSRITNDIETINQTLNQSLTQMITCFITVAGIIIMMLRISFTMTIIALLTIPLSLLLIKLIVGKSQKHFKAQQNYLGKVNGHVEEMYTGHSIIKAFNKEEEARRLFTEYNEGLCTGAWKSQFISGLMMPITSVITNLGYVAVCLLGGYLAINAKITIGEIQAFIQYVRSMQQPLQMVANVANQLQSTVAAAERVFALLEAEEESDAYDERAAESAQEYLGAIKGNVGFNHISFGYDADNPVINDFSYDAKAGQRIAIVGPTGAGKTTIVKLLMRFYELDGGSITVDGRDIKSYSRCDLRKMFGMVLQDTWLYNGSVRDNIRYGRPEATPEEVESAAGAAYIDHFIRTQTDGYDTMINEEATNISQGQKQLLTIARAILADAPILILDEATSSVDTRTEIRIQKAMNNLMSNRTCFIIAHRLSTIKDADHILVMDHGDIVEQGNHEELLSKGGFYAKLYNSQFAG